MADRDMDERVGTLEIAMRQIMEETGVKHSRDGQPLYTGAYRDGFTAGVERAVRAMDLRGWPRTVETLGVLFGILWLLTLIAWVFK